MNRVILLVVGVTMLMALLIGGGVFLLVKRFPRIRERLTRPLTPMKVWGRAAFWTAGQAIIDFGLLKTGNLPNPHGAFTALPSTFLFFIVFGYLGIWAQKRKQSLP